MIFSGPYSKYEKLFRSQKVNRNLKFNTTTSCFISVILKRLKKRLKFLLASAETSGKYIGHLREQVLFEKFY